MMNCSSKLRTPSQVTLKHLHFTGIRPYEQGSLIQSYISNQHVLAKLDKNLPKPSQTILSFEFNSIYTGGRREKLRSHDYFQDKQVPFIQTSRGGEITYHGPGQVVVYPILDLLILKLKSKCYIDTLERTIKKTLHGLGISTVDSKNTGVWVDEKTKISSIGVNIQRSITSHGISINNDPDLKYFNDADLVICGLPGTRQTSVREQLGHCPTVEKLGELFVDELAGDLKISDVQHLEIDKNFNEANIKDIDMYIYD